MPPSRASSRRSRSRSPLSPEPSSSPPGLQAPVPHLQDARPSLPPLSPVQASPVTPRASTSPAILSQRDTAGPDTFENRVGDSSGTGAFSNTGNDEDGLGIETLGSVSGKEREKRKSKTIGPGATAATGSHSEDRKRAGSFTPSIGSRVRSASLSLAEMNPRPGIWAATGELIAKGELVDSRRSSMIARENAGSRLGRESRQGGRGRGLEGVQEKRAEERAGVVVEGVGKWAKTKRGLLWFWNFVTTPMGAFITIYSLCVVVFGAWLFFLLLNALPSYNGPNGPNHPDSPRRIWIEINSQIMNALFCLTAFGLFPWRARDAYYLVRWRFAGDEGAGARIREINQGWYVPSFEDSVKDAASRQDTLERIASLSSTHSSTSLDSKAALPPPPEEPPTAHTSAPPTKPWKLHFVIWMYIMNTALQCVLCGFMWGYDRITRPGAAVGVLVALGCGVAGAAGIMVWWEGRRVKKMSTLTDEEKRAGSGRS